EHPGVSDAVTLNVSSGEMVRLWTFVAVPGGEKDMEAGALAFLRAGLPSYMVPERVVVLPALPLMPNGKVDRRRLLALAEAPAAARPPAGQTGNPVEAKLLAAWKDILGRTDLHPAESFSSIGGDSLSYVSAYLALEQEIGLVPDNWAHLSIADLARAGEFRQGGRWSTKIESPILIRAIAICLVVAEHMQLVGYGASATSALFWVSGLLFGQLQLFSTASSGSVRNIFRLLAGVLAPLLLL